MLVFALSFAVVVAAFALAFVVASLAPEWMMFAIVALSALGAAAIRLVTMRFARHWTLKRSWLVSVAVLPLFFWLVALGVDIWIVLYHRWFAPGESYMGGFSIILFAPCAFAVIVVRATSAIVDAIFGPPPERRGGGDAVDAEPQDPVGGEGDR